MTSKILQTEMISIDVQMDSSLETAVAIRFFYRYTRLINNQLAKYELIINLSHPLNLHLLNFQYYSVPLNLPHTNDFSLPAVSPLKTEDHTMNKPSAPVSLSVGLETFYFYFRPSAHHSDFFFLTKSGLQLFFFFFKILRAFFQLKN